MFGARNYPVLSNLVRPGKTNQVRWKLSLQPQEERDQVLNQRSESFVQASEWIGFIYSVFGHVYLLQSRRYVVGEPILGVCPAVENED